MSYVTGFLQPVPKANKDAYKKSVEDSWEIMKDYGLLSIQENWGDDVPDGKVTSFPMAVKLEKDEVVVFSWLIWPDKETARTGFEAAMRDPRMEAMELPLDGKRMMWGGFIPLVRLSLES